MSPANAPELSTLAIDVGGSGIKAIVLDATGQPLNERTRVETPYPCPPQKFLSLVAELVTGFPPFDRVSIGFPAMVRDGKTLRVVAFARAVKDGPRDPELFELWDGYPLESAIEELLGVPTLLANDADVQGCAVISGKGTEFVMTLGTGVGTSLFHNGHMLPHMELSHGTFAGESIDVALGNAYRKEVGNKYWIKLVGLAVEDFNAKLFPDRIYIGGGNSKLLKDVDLGPLVEIVPNTAGLMGGIKLWEFSQ
jgi:polyphosphate glucokinase